MWNDKTAAIVRKYPDRFIGLCGVDPRLPGLSENLADCLRNLEMKGMKIRINDSGLMNDLRFSNKEIFDTVSSAISQNPAAKVALIHVANHDHYTLRNEKNSWHDDFTLDEIFKADERELDFLIELAQKHPEVKFILAHSLASHRMTNILADKLSGKDVPNLFLEISKAFLGPLEGQEDAYLLGWKKIGMEKIFYGSDVTLGYPDNWSYHGKKFRRLSVPEALNADFQFAHELIPQQDDQDLVFKKNGRKLLEEIK